MSSVPLSQPQQGTDLSQPGRYGRLTQKSLYILRAAVIWPVGVLQMPHCPFLAGQKVLDFQACGCIATRICAELGGHLEFAVGGCAVLGAQFGPVPMALGASALLDHTQKPRKKGREGEEERDRREGGKKGERMSSQGSALVSVHLTTDLSLYRATNSL